MTYLAKLSQLINELAERRESFVSAEIAAEIEENYGDLVAEWLTENARTLLTQFVGDQLRHARKKARGINSDSSLSASIMKWTFVVDDENTRKQFGAMTGTDNLFVARQYATDAQEARLHEKIHRSIAKKVGDRRVEEVFTEEQLASLFGIKVDGAAA